MSDTIDVLTKAAEVLKDAGEVDLALTLLRYIENTKKANGRV